MKYSPFYKWQYIVQIKLDFYETLRANILGFYKIIQHCKVDQIILNSSQEPSTSFKYDHILDALLIMLGSWKSVYNSRMTYNVDLLCKFWHQKWSNTPKLQLGTINILQVQLCHSCTYNYAKELKIWIQLRNDKLFLFMIANLITERIQSSKTLVRNHQCPQNMTVYLKDF